MSAHQADLDVIERVLIEHRVDMECGDYGAVLWSGCECGHGHSYDQHDRHVAEQVAAAIVAGQAAVVRSLIERVESAYPAEQFPREWVLGEDRRSGTVRHFLDMLMDCAERVSPPAPKGGADV